MYVVFQVHEKLSENLSPMARPNVVFLFQTADQMSLSMNLTNKFMKFVKNIVNVYNLKVSYSQLALIGQIDLPLLLKEGEDNL